MRKITLIICLFFALISGFSQNRAGSLFYSEVERTETNYNIHIDIFEIGNIEYIEIELVDEQKVELVSEFAQLIQRNDKYFLSYKDEEKEVYLEDISISIKNEYNSIKYPQINVKLMDKQLRVLDYSQKIFY